MRASEFNAKLTSESFDLNEAVLDEFRASPTNLAQLAANISARAGMEFEMIVPGFRDEEASPEADYGMDERAYSIEDVINFFDDGDFNSRRDLQRARATLDDQFIEWAGEKFDEVWVETGVSRIYEWLRDTLDDDDIRKELDLDDDVEIERDHYREFAEKCFEEQNSFYDDVRDDAQTEFYNDADQEDFLDSIGIRHMSDAESELGLSWPHYDYDSGGSDISIEDIADEFEGDIGRSVAWSKNYHGARRAEGTYSLEPDSSLEGEDGEGGLEFISPPLPINELLSDLDKVKAFANRMGFYTNQSTGLHINVSINGADPNKLDYVKLAILLGDEYVLQQFGRLGNTYTKSALNIVKQRAQQRPEDTQALLQQMKSHMNELASKLIHTGNTDKYTSINNKTGYIEFRSAGGDWLDENFDKIKATLLRFVVALDAAYDPTKYRDEYLKKLYKILSPSGQEDSFTAAYAKFQAGQISKGEFKNIVATVQAKRQAKKAPIPGAQPPQPQQPQQPASQQAPWRRWLVRDPATGREMRVSARDITGAVETARANYPAWANTDLDARIEESVAENFADGKKPGRKGLAKRMGVDCTKSETELRKIAKRSSGEKQRMAHWCANMKGGKK